MVHHGRFRVDLYYRVSAHSLCLPPLRERLEDLPLLAAHFMEEAARSLGQPSVPLDPSALAVLAAHPFPGNIRELRAILMDALCRPEGGPIDAAWLSNRLGHAVGPSPKGIAAAASKTAAPSAGTAASGETQVLFPGPLPSLREVADLLVDEAMQRSGGNQSRAAALIGISHQALSKRLRIRTEGEQGMDGELP
jgi:DNA-binding NtrC family response regulator